MISDEFNEFVAHIRQSDGMPQTVQEHLEGTSTLASDFAGKIGLSSLGALTGLLHDIGKYSAAFQRYIRGSGQKRGEIDHSSAGAQLLWESYQNKQSPLFQLVSQIIALCVASHHSTMIDCISLSGEDRFNNRMMKPIQPTCLIEEEELIREKINALVTSSLIGDELRRHLEILDQCKQSSVANDFTLGLMTRFLFSALIDADRLNTADFENETAAQTRYNGSYPKWSILIRKLERHLARFETRNQVDEIRKKVSTACQGFANRDKGLYQLTVPTGGGKTLASLRFALHHAEKQGMQRIIYIAPYISIIDQNASVVRSILESGNKSGRQIVLEHHSNLTPAQDTDQSKILSQNWDAPIVFTTAVQLLETLFGSGTRGVRRMHQLANSVIIFDEVQTIPINTIHLFNNAINFLVRQCGSTVVFCTATQPILDKVDADKGSAMLSANSQMMPDVESLFRDLRRVEVVDKRKNGGWSEDEIVDVVLNEMNECGSVLIVVNTKAQARTLYKRCKCKTDNVYHLSTGMCPAHRMQNLDKIKQYLDPRNPKPVICISTQLIEAGVDIDFNSVIRYLAGLDSIAQVAGRCNRNGLRAIGRVLIVNSAQENLDKLPDIRKAQEITIRLLGEFQSNPAAFDNDLLSPAAMSRYYEYYFFERANEMDYPVSPKDNNIDRNDTLLSLLSTNTQSIEAYRRINKTYPSLCLRQSFKTAAEAFEPIDSPSEGVIVPYEEGVNIIADLLASVQFDKKSKLLRKAQRYSVNMFTYEIQKLRERGGLREVWEGSGVLYLDLWHYSEEFGVSIEPINQNETLVV